MQLILVRHGECVDNNGEVLLTEKGKKQSLLLADRLSKIKIDKIYVSTALRAIQTAEPYILKNPKASVIKTEKLQEIYRVLIGGPVKPGTKHSRKKDDKIRANEIFNELTKFENKTIVVFCHGNIIRYFIAKIMNLKKADLWTKLLISHSSVSIIEKKGSLSRIKMINNVEHLEGEGLKTFYSDSLDESDYYP